MTHETLKALIYGVGFHNNKTIYIKKTADILYDNFNGDVPPTAEEMIKYLPGVGPKMAYLIDQIAWKRPPTGIGTDTHMHRIFNSLKWVNSKNPEDTRLQLEGWLPREYWEDINLLWVGYGQESQQEKEKSLRKALDCSRPKDALGLLKIVGMDVKKDAKKYKMEEEVKKVLES
jgi:endonuclease III